MITNVEGLERFRKLMESVELPPRQPKGHKDNVLRSLTMQAAFHQEKVNRQNDAWKQKHLKQECHLCQFKVTLRDPEQR